MNILCIGDIVGSCGRGMIRKYLDELVRKEQIDLVIANGENAAHGRGMTRKVYEELCSYGIDGFTMGNHTWGCKDIIPILENNINVARPANYSGTCPGRGSILLKSRTGEKAGIINLMGRTYMDPCESPFLQADKEIEALKKHTDTIFVDFHAEATSEKIAMGWYLDGRVTAVFGTHTHVQTADETILPKGTGYITDLGMTGPVYSVLGMERGIVVSRFLNGMPQKFEVAEGAGKFCACLFSVENGKTTAVKRILIQE